MESVQMTEFNALMMEITCVKDRLTQEQSLLTQDFIDTIEHLKSILNRVDSCLQGMTDANANLAYWMENKALIDSFRTNISQKKYRTAINHVDVDRYHPIIDSAYRTLSDGVQYYKIDKSKLLRTCDCREFLSPKDRNQTKEKFLARITHYAKDLYRGSGGERAIKILSFGSGFMGNELLIMNALNEESIRAEWIFIDEAMLDGGNRSGGNTMDFISHYALSAFKDLTNCAAFMYSSTRSYKQAVGSGCNVDILMCMDVKIGINDLGKALSCVVGDGSLRDKLFFIDYDGQIYWREDKETSFHFSRPSPHWSEPLARPFFPPSLCPEVSGLRKKKRLLPTEPGAVGLSSADLLRPHVGAESPSQQPVMVSASYPDGVLAKAEAETLEAMTEAPPVPVNVTVGDASLEIRQDGVLNGCDQTHVSPDEARLISQQPQDKSHQRNYCSYLIDQIISWFSWLISCLVNLFSRPSAARLSPGI